MAEEACPRLCGDPEPGRVQSSARKAAASAGSRAPGPERSATGQQWPGRLAIAQVVPLSAVLIALAVPRLQTVSP